MRPEITQNCHTKEWTRNYNQYAILDLAEFVYKNAKDYEGVKEHKFYGHTHICFNKKWYAKGNFRYKLNELFEKTELLYHMNDDGGIERVVFNEAALKIVEKTLRVLLKLLIKQ